MRGSRLTRWFSTHRVGALDSLQGVKHCHTPVELATRNIVVQHLRVCVMMACIPWDVWRYLTEPGACSVRLIKHHGVGKQLITDGVIDLEKVLWWLMAAVSIKTMVANIPVSCRRCHSL